MWPPGYNGGRLKGKCIAVEADLKVAVSGKAVYINVTSWVLNISLERFIGKIYSFLVFKTNCLNPYIKVKPAQVLYYLSQANLFYRKSTKLTSRGLKQLLKFPTSWDQIQKMLLILSTYRNLTFRSDLLL